MNRNFFYGVFVALLVVVVIVAAGAAVAQQSGGRGMGFGRGMAHGFGVGGGGNCGRASLDMAQSATFSGTVKSFEGGPGIGRPTLILNTAAGERTFIIAPYRVVRDSELQFVPGRTFTVTAAPNASAVWMATSVKDEVSGVQLVLRDAHTGQPAGGQRGSCLLNR